MRFIVFSFDDDMAEFKLSLDICFVRVKHS